MLNLTSEQIQSNVGKGDDPLREFSGICRHEFEVLWNGFNSQNDHNSQVFGTDSWSRRWVLISELSL